MKKRIITIIFSVLVIGGILFMADKNIQMGQRNSSNTEWDKHYPITKAENVITSDGTVASDITAIKTNKAEKSYVDTIASSIASGSPSKVFTTLTSLQADDAANTTDGKKKIYLVVANGNWYYWNDTAWTAGGVYQSFFASGKNMLNKDIAIKGSYVRMSDGNTVYDANYYYFDYIDISSHQGSNLAFTDCGQGAFYDANKGYLSGFANATSPAIVLIPSNATYIRVSVPNSTLLQSAQMELGDEATDYENYWVANDEFIKKPSIFTTTEIVVKADGIVGVDCKFTNISSAMDSIVNNSSTNRYVVKILNGTYDVSNDGQLHLGFKNYVDIVEQSRDGVKIIKREAVYSVTKSTFDSVHYAQTIEYASIRNCTIISYNTKCPIHLDDEYFKTIKIIDCNLINENTPDMGNYQNGLACGLRKGQHVIARGCNTNGMLWAHNTSVHYLDDGCSFELYNCISKYITVGDLLSYGHDVFIVEGCKTEFIRYLYYKDFGNELSYAQPSWETQLKGNTIEYVEAVTTIDGGYTWVETGFDELYNGKWGIVDGSIHNYCKNTSGNIIPKHTLVSLDADKDMDGIKGWVSGDRLYGVALDTIAQNNFGIVQYKGFAPISADGATPIAYNDAIELNSSGIAVKHTTGEIIGYARESLASGTGVIKIKLASQ